MIMRGDYIEERPINVYLYSIRSNRFKNIISIKQIIKIYELRNQYFINGPLEPYEIIYEFESNSLIHDHFISLKKFKMKEKINL